MTWQSRDATSAHRSHRETRQHMHSSCMRAAGAHCEPPSGINSRTMATDALELRAANSESERVGVRSAQADANDVACMRA